MKKTNLLTYLKVANGSSLYEPCYRFWKSSWEHTLRELRADNHLPLLSDAFIYRTKNCLFFDSVPVGIFLTEVIVADSVWRDHSYFQMYPTDIRQKVLSSHQSVLALSYIAIDEAWRKSQTDISILELIFGLGTMDLFESGAHALVSCVRKNRKVDSAFSCYGAVSIGGGTAFNADVEYMVLDRSAVLPHGNSSVQNELNRLWNKSKGVDCENTVRKGYPSNASNLFEHALGG